MLAFEGPPSQYAYTRVRCPFSVKRRRAGAGERAPVMSATEDCKCEARFYRLLQFEETLTVVAREGTPHVMCAHSPGDASLLFSGFYEHFAPILSAENDAVRNSR